MLPRALSGLKFGKFSVPNGTVHSGCTDPTRATARLVIVLVSWMPKNGTGDNKFFQMKRDIAVRPTEKSGRVKVDHLLRWSQIFRSDRTEMVRSIWFLTEISGILGWMESAPSLSSFPIYGAILHPLHRNEGAFKVTAWRIRDFFSPFSKKCASTRNHFPKPSCSKTTIRRFHKNLHSRDRLQTPVFIVPKDIVYVNLVSRFKPGNEVAFTCARKA